MMFRGIILTDSVRLGSTLHTKQEAIIESIQGFISQCQSFIEWHLVDVSDDMYRQDIVPQDWHTHARVLEDYYYGLGIDHVDNCPLFILGGDNDIPMPQIINPSTYGREFVDTDMLYCFSNEAENNPLAFITERPRFVPGRLPFCNGNKLKDLTSYLSRCVSNILNGIEAPDVIMTTTESWIPASTTMMHDIPTPSLSSDYVPLNNRMIVSPLLDIENLDMFEGYVHELNKTNFLVCNLHGSPNKHEPFFLGEDKELQMKCVAIHPNVLYHTTPAIFNTVACFGGRFIGYDIGDSMLYTALQNGTAIYTGSCDLALGGVQGIGYSELLMKLYNIYLLQGKPAGMALMQAKRHYYNTCHAEENNDQGTMFTILEFNLFGCPMVNVKPIISQDYQPKLLGHNIQETYNPAYKTAKLVPVQSSAYNADDILAYVRARVDDNLSKIREKIEKEVYECIGLTNQNLISVYRVQIDDLQVGWQFIYNRMLVMQYSGFSTTYFVNTTQSGEIKSIYQTK